MSKNRNIIRKRLKANTLVELLLTMIISGIIFLLVFDGVDIIRRFSHMVNNRISTNQTVLYSHQFMEHLVENADSIVKRGNKLLFYRESTVSDSVAIGDSFFILETPGLTDTLFAGYINYGTSPTPDNTNHIDSIFIHCAINTRDSIWLEYGLPSNRYAYLNSIEDYEDFR
ncbi:hypothetical protein [Proteiniphilum sp.]|uniref:hypothetical protein n=1 Tax=Proteiniphilum sp. TaxID=1926877 RepID=UPI002B206B5F|nr:hypothetical protein [Proteiniphilum sp.]MEA4918883.1 hypothetical protein [Proteiniphilum sp.]